MKKNRIKGNQKLVKRIVLLRNSGLSFKKIAKKIKCSTKTVSKVIKASSLEYSKDKTNTLLKQAIPQILMSAICPTEERKQTLGAWVAVGEKMGYINTLFRLKQIIDKTR